MYDHLIALLLLTVSHVLLVSLAGFNLTLPQALNHKAITRAFLRRVSEEWPDLPGFDVRPCRTGRGDARRLPLRRQASGVMLSAVKLFVSTQGR